MATDTEKLRQALVGVVYEELVRLMGGANASLNLAAQPPALLFVEP